MTAGPVVAQPIERKVLYRVSEAIEILSLSRSTVYELIRSGRLRTVKEGGTRLVPANAISEYVTLLEWEAMPKA